MDELTWPGVTPRIGEAVIRVGDAVTLLRAAERQGAGRSGTFPDRIQ